MSHGVVIVPMVAGWSPAVNESTLVDGADGAEARFRAVGASEELYDLAIRRHDVPGTSDDDSDAPRYGVVRSDGRFEIGWSSAAGLCSMLSAYGAHLVTVRAYAHGRLDDLARVLASGRFAEARGRVVQRADEALRVQAIRAGEADAITLTEMTSDERAIWERLADRCQCPACVTRTWSTSEADALATEIERDPKTGVPRVPHCMAPTQALVRAAILAGAYPGGVGWRRIPSWRNRNEAAAMARELLGHKKLDVRLAALSACLDAASDADTAVALVDRALNDKPKLADLAIRRSSSLPNDLRRAAHERVLHEAEAGLRTELRATVLSMGWDWLRLDRDHRERLRVLATAWRADSELEALVIDLEKHRFGS